MTNSKPVHGTWEQAPAARWEDGFLSGNGHHGALVYGDPRDDRVVVTHHTLVRPNGSETARAPELAAQLPELQDRLLAGDLTAAEDFTDHRPLRWVQPFHPAFQTRIERVRETAPTPRYRRTVDFTTGVTTAIDADWTSRVFVSRADDVIVQYVTAPGLTADISLDHRLAGAPDELAVERSALLAEEGATLTLTARYPDSEKEFTGATAVTVTGGTVTRTESDGIRVENADAVLLLTRVHRDTAPGRAPVAEEAGPGTPRSYDTLLARHLPLHRTAYSRVTLDLHADPAQRALPGSELLAHPKSPALLERLFAAGRYHLLSASGLLPPRLTGLWTGDWDTAWAGAFTLDANLNLQTSSAACADLPEVTEALRNLIERQLDDWRANARAIFGARGIQTPAHTDGESGHSFHYSREYPLHLWTAGADWLLKPLVDHDETSGERDPRTAAVLAELAEFYEDFLSRTATPADENDPGGTIVIVPSYSPENRPANASWGAINAAMDLSAARHALLTAADYHSGNPEKPETPGEAARARATRWRTLAHRLPPHRINPDGALAEWAWPGLQDSYDHRHLSHLYAVWPLDEITPYDTPELAEAAHRALQLRGAENDSAHGHLHHALIAARLKDADRVERALAAVLEGDFFHASLMSAHYPDRHVYNADAAHTLPTVLIEALVQSTPGRLVLLPAPPAALGEGELRGVRTRFGATVDLAWDATGARAVVRPTRTLRVELRTSTGTRPLDLVTGEDHVLDLGTR